MAKKNARRQGGKGAGSKPSGGQGAEKKPPENEAEKAEGAADADEADAAAEAAQDEGAEEGGAEEGGAKEGAKVESAKAEGAKDSAKAEPRKAPEKAAASGDGKAAAPKVDEPSTSTEDKPYGGAPWGRPLVRFDQMWTRLEVRLLVGVLAAQLLSMLLWVVLGGLASPVQPDRPAKPDESAVIHAALEAVYLANGNAGGTVMRSVLGMVLFGTLAWAITGRMNRAAGATPRWTESQRSSLTGGAIFFGMVLGPLWRKAGIDYFDNVRAWLQEGSTLTLMGGLRGVATRLTLWMALLGGSVATAYGKHINVDVVYRFLPAKLRIPVAVANYGAAALVCFGAVWGFFDHIAIESFGADKDATASEKIEISTHRMGDHLFLLRKQIGLDLKAFSHIASGDRFDRWMGPAEWNSWVKEASFESRYPKETVESLFVPDDAPPHTPLVVAPDGESTRGIFVHDLSLVFPFGLGMIGLRFLLRILLALSGNVRLDPEAAHGGDEAPKDETKEASAGLQADKGGA